jgi:hypothetical protein
MRSQQGEESMPDNNEPAGGPAPASAGGGSTSSDTRRKRDTGGVTEQAKASIGTAAETVTSGVDQLAQAASDQIAQANEKARGLVADQKDYLADQIGGMAAAMDRVAGDLEQSSESTAHYARLLADNAEKLSTSIRDNSIDELMSQAQDFGRRQPAVFLGAAALLGFAASRFLLASANRSNQTVPESEAEDEAGYMPEPNGLEAGAGGSIETGRT